MLFSSMIKSIYLGSFRRATFSRTDVWLETLSYIKDLMMFEYGLDALLCLSVWRGNIVQHHSFLIRFLLEFGIVGTSGSY
jgi:hypothetical protein